MVNACFTDNESLARYLVNEFAAHFGAFKGAEALQSMDYVKLTGVAAAVRRGNHAEEGDQGRERPVGVLL